MGKFFKSKPKQCSVCKRFKPIKKKVWGKGHKFYYCHDCWNEQYSKAYGKVFKAVKEKAKRGEKVSLANTKELVREIVEDRKE